MDEFLLAPYEELKTKGFPGYTNWLKNNLTVDDGNKIDITRLCCNPTTFHRLRDALAEFYRVESNSDRDASLSMEWINIGPSGFHKDVPTDKLKIK